MQVDPDEVPDYASVIAYPMDFATMSDKIDQGDYLWCVQVAVRVHMFVREKVFEPRKVFL